MSRTSNYGTRLRSLLASAARPSRDPPSSASRGRGEELGDEPDITVENDGTSTSEAPARASGGKRTEP